MLTDMPVLTHQQQQQAVDRIQALMDEGMSSGEAIRLVSSEIRATHSGERVTISWDENDNEGEEDGEAIRAAYPEEQIYLDDEQDEEN